MANFPVFTPDPRWFPMPTLQQGSPFGGVLSDAIAKRLGMAKAQTAEAELPYAGLSKLAQILSQSAYAGAVMPQFQAKLLSNPNILPNIKDPQKKAQALLDLGITPNSNSPLNQHINNELMKISLKQKQDNSLGGIGKSIMGLLQGSKPNEQLNSINERSNLEQGSIIPQNEFGAINKANPALIEEIANNGNNAYQGGRTPENIQFGENIANFGRQTAKGPAQGTAEGKQQAEYGEGAAGVIEQERAVTDLKNVLQDPIYKKIANTPFLNKSASFFYRNAGYPEEQRAMGELDSAMNNLVGASFGMFPGRVTNKDMDYLFTLKPNENDTLNVKLGKITSLLTFGESKRQQIEKANRYMSQGMSKADAEFKAGKEINVNKIRNDIKKDIYPSNEKVNEIKQSNITVENLQHTARELGISVPEVIERLERKGIKIPERLS